MAPWLPVQPGARAADSRAPGTWPSLPQHPGEALPELEERAYNLTCLQEHRGKVQGPEPQVAVRRTHSTHGRGDTEAADGNAGAWGQGASVPQCPCHPRHTAGALLPVLKVCFCGWGPPGVCVGSRRRACRTTMHRQSISKMWPLRLHTKLPKKATGEVRPSGYQAPGPPRWGKLWGRAGAHSMAAEGSGQPSWACLKARSVNCSTWCSPRSTGQERSAPPRSRQSRTLPCPHDAILRGMRTEHRSSPQCPDPPGDVIHNQGWERRSPSQGEVLGPQSPLRAPVPAPDPSPSPSIVDGWLHHLVSSKKVTRKAWTSKSVCAFARTTTSPPRPTWPVPQATTICNKPRLSPHSRASQCRLDSARPS